MLHFWGFISIASSEHFCFDIYIKYEPQPLMYLQTSEMFPPTTGIMRDLIPYADSRVFYEQNILLKSSFNTNLWFVYVNILARFCLSAYAYF